jgi:hypothetical protein
MIYTKVKQFKFNENEKNWFVTLEYVEAAELQFWMPQAPGMVSANTVTFVITTVPDHLKIPDVAVESYKAIDTTFQIDADGNIFASMARSMRFNWTPLDCRAVRYATQMDFDKMCCDNPDSRYPYDWNAEVYKLFMKFVPTIMTSDIIL